MNARFLPMLLLSLALGSCASSYGPRSLTGGYADARIDDNHYTVRFDGNGYTSSERVWNFWFYRCAELTAQKGFTFFTVETVGPNGVSLRDRTPEDGFTPAVYTPGKGLAPAIYTPEDRGGIVLVHGHGGGAHFVYIPGVAINVQTWHEKSVVAMYNGTVPNGVDVVYRAQSVLQDLGPYIQANGDTQPPPKQDVLNHAAVATRPSYGAPQGPSF
jgi:hypothetical protein